jgi:predicted RNase H-like HicB family nuclease
MPRKKLADQAMTEIRVVFEPDEDGWLVRAPDVQGCHAWGRSIAEARSHIREALATCVDVFPDPDAVARDARLIEDIRLPASLRRAVRRAERAREQAAKARAIEADAARAITDALSLRDAGELLGLSPEGVRRLKAG